MDNHISGTVTFLKVVENLGSSYLLHSEEGEEVTLNASEISQDDELQIGEEYSFFVYPSRSGKLFATSEVPDILADRYDWAKVVKVDRDGVALDIGIPREVLVPWEDLPKLKEVWPQQGDEILVCLRTDYHGQLFARLASEGIVDDLYTKADEEMMNKTIVARPYRLLRVGSFLLSKEGYKIFVHESERQSEPRLGQEIEVRIIGVKPTGELNGSFLPRAHERLDDDATAIYDYLVAHDGVMDFTDKSDPEDIKDTFNMSKASFKRALGRLMKNKKIIQHNGQTKVVKY